MLAALATPPAAWASSNAGIQIELGKFKLHVYYSVALDYRAGADQAIRDPGKVLFALASTIQANAEAFAAIDHTIEAELLERQGAAEPFLVVLEDPESRTAVLQDAPVGRRGLGSAIRRVLCSRYPGACSRPARPRLDLYRCQKGSCPGRIRFGSFPSDSVNEGFGLLPGKGGSGKPLHVTAAEMLRYFEYLE